MKDDVQLFAVLPAGPVRLALPRSLASIHDLPEDLPFGIYTALRTFDHDKFLYLQAHLDRMQQSLDLLGWDYALDRTRLRQALAEVCADYPRADARVRIDVLAAPAKRWAEAPRLLLTLAPFEPVPSRHYRDGVRVGLARRLQRVQPLAKRADFVLARRDYPLGRPEAYDYLLLDADERILEGSSSNFYALRDGTLWTAGDGILEGITRKIVLQELVETLSIPVRLEPPPLSQIDTFAEAFLSSSSRGLIPVVNIAGMPVGEGRPGSLTRRLMDAYQHFVAAAIRPAV